MPVWSHRRPDLYGHIQAYTRGVYVLLLLGFSHPVVNGSTTLGAVKINFTMIKVVKKMIENFYIQIQCCIAEIFKFVKLG